MPVRAFCTRLKNRLNVKRVALVGVTVNDQYRFLIGELHDAPAPIVGRHRVIGQNRLDNVFARFREVHLHALRHGLARLDPLDLQGRRLVHASDRSLVRLLGHRVACVEVGAHLQLHILGCRIAIVRDRHVHEQRHARRTRLVRRLQVGDRQVASL